MRGRIINPPSTPIAPIRVQRVTERAASREAALNRGRALFALHAAVALFGFAALFGKWILLPATVIVLGRTVVAASTLAAVIVMRGQSIGRAQVATVANGAILALHWVSFFAAVQAASVAVALLGYATFPL